MNKLYFIWLFVALILMNVAFADIEGYGCGMGGMIYGSYGTGFALFGWLFAVLIVIALILFIVWIIKQLQKDSRGVRK